MMFALVGIAQAASAATPSKGAESIVRLSGVVNLNTADAEQLQMLPGVGEKRAEAIIAIRSSKQRSKYCVSARSIFDRVLALSPNDLTGFATETREFGIRGALPSPTK